jgi:hypothetical protein
MDFGAPELRSMLGAKRRLQALGAEYRGSKVSLRVSGQPRAVPCQRAGRAKGQSAFRPGFDAAEGQGTKNFSDALTDAGMRNTYFESLGTAHEWLMWRRRLYDLAPRPFR